ncbi:MAG: hypothetical protein AABX84_01825 [Nanoarchaeota archaeon]
MRVYRKKNSYPLPVLEGMVEFPEIYHYNKDIGRNEIVFKFCIKGKDTLFVLEPPFKDIEGNVRVHYELSFSGKHATVLVVELPNGGSYVAKKFNGEYEFRD